MKRELKEKWLAALRSGEYKQGVGALCQITNYGQDREYCCLGVLAEVCDDIHSAENPNGDKETMVYYLPGAFSAHQAGSLNQAMRDKVGLADLHQEVLIQMNDGKGPFQNNPVDFLRIADWIEENVIVDWKADYGR